MTLLAGAAVRDVTPTRPMFLVGYPNVPRTSTGVHDPLYATALCLRNEQASMLLISVDVLYIHHDTAGACREAIQLATGVPAGNILISATHTHSGPVTAEMLAWENDSVVPPPDPSYMERLQEAVIQAAREAWEAAVPAELAVSGARVEGVGGNRISVNGPRDPELGLLVVRRQDDRRLLAIDLVYSMHPTVLHEDSTLVSGDFPAFARRRLREEYPGAVVVYHTGPSGNQSPRHDVREQTFAEAERLGRKLGEAALAALGAMRDDAFSDRVSLGVRRRFVTLPARTFPGLPDAEEELRRSREAFHRLRSQGAERAGLRTAEVAVFGAEEGVALASAQASGKTRSWVRQYRRTEVQVFKIGSLFIAGLPGELFVEYGLEIKRKAPGRAFVIELANGELQGYIVTPEAEAAGGYEASNSFFKPKAGRLLVRTSLKLMKEFAP